MKIDARFPTASSIDEIWDAAARDAFASEGGSAGVTPESSRAAARQRREARLMRSLLISRAGIDYMFAGFRYDLLSDAVSHARRYIGKDAIGGSILLRPPDAQD